MTTFTEEEIKLLEEMIQENKCCGEQIFIYEANEYVYHNGKIVLSWDVNIPRIILFSCGKCDKIMFTHEL